MLWTYDGKDDVVRTLTVHFDPLPDKRQGTMAEFAVRLNPRGQQRIDVSLVIGESKDRTPVRRVRPDPAGVSPLESEARAETQDWMAQVTRVATNGLALDQLMERSSVDSASCTQSWGTKRFLRLGCRGSSRCSVATA